MKRGAKLVCLVAVLAVVSGGAVAVSKMTDNAESEQVEDTSVTVLELDSESVSAISWTYNDETVSMVKNSDSWQYAEDSNFPLDETYISSMLSALSNVNSSKTIDNATDLSAYGLDNPVCTVSVNNGENELSIGNESAMGGEVYFSNGDGNVYLVSSSVLSPFEYGLYDIISMETVPTMDDISSIKVDAESKSYNIVHLENSGLAYSDSYTWFLKDSGDYTTLDTELTESLVSEVKNLTFSECVDYNASGKLADYGLDNPALSIKIMYGETESFIVEFGDYSGSSCYAKIKDSDMVYLVDSSVCDDFINLNISSILPDEVLLMDYDTVESVDIILDGETYTVEKSTEDVTDDDGNTSTQTVWSIDGNSYDFESIWTELDSITSTGSDENIVPERSAEIEFVFHRNTENFPEVELVFYQYNSSDCLVSLNGESRLFADRSLVVSLVENINALVL